MKRINKKDLDLHPNYAHLDLWYNVRDYENCEQVRFYTHAKINKDGHRKGELYELPVRILDHNQWRRKRGIGPNIKPDNRRLIQLLKNGKKEHLLCAHLVFKIGWTFPIPDRPHYVIDHIDGNTLNDRRNNLRLITAKENVNTPACREARLKNLGVINYGLNKGLTAAQRHEIHAHRLRVMKLTGHMPSYEDVRNELFPRKEVKDGNS